MGQYASTIPDFEPEVVRIIDQVLFEPSPLRDKLLSHVEQALRVLGVIPANAPSTPLSQSIAAGQGTPADPVAGSSQPGPDGLSAEQAAGVAANTGTVSEGEQPAPWRYDPLTGRPISQPSDPQPVTFGTAAGDPDQTGGPTSAVAGT